MNSQDDDVIILNSPEPNVLPVHPAPIVAIAANDNVAILNAPLPLAPPSRRNANSDDDDVIIIERPQPSSARILQPAVAPGDSLKSINSTAQQLFGVSNLPNLPFKVPVITLNQIFGYVDILDQFRLSLTCREAIAHMWSSRITSGLLILHFDKLGGFGIDTNEAQFLIECDYFEYTAGLRAGKTQLFGAHRVLVRPVVRVMHLGRMKPYTMIVCKTRHHAAKFYRALFNFYLKIVRPEFFLFEDHQTDYSKEFGFLMNRIKVFKVLRFYLNHAFNNDHLRKILEEYTVDVLIIRGEKENNEWSYNGVLKSEKMIVHVGCWITSHLLKTMTCQEMWARNTYISIAEISELLMLWKNGELNNFQQLFITKKLGGNYKKSKLNADLGLQRWQIPMRIPEEEVERYFHPSCTWHLRNTEGTLAFVGVQRKVFQFLISDYPTNNEMFRYWSEED